jgi:LacI family transcriptional regulator
MRPSEPRRRTVLLALTLTHHGFYQGAIRYAAEHDWHLVADAIYTASIPAGWKGDGILSFVGYRRDLAKYIKEASIPVVEISSVRRDLGLPCAAEDNEEIGRSAAEHLLERNFKHFAWAPFWEDLVNEDRFSGFAELIRSEGYDCERLPPLNTQRSKRGRQSLDWVARRNWLIQKFRSFKYPVGIFCYNDYVAADIIGICLDSKIHVPEEIAVIGVDNDPIVAASIPIPLSSVRHDLEGLAYHAAELLDRLMDGESPGQDTELVRPKGVVTRRSTDILAIQNPKVLQGIRFIRENFAQANLSVERVVAASDLARRSLEKAFRLELNRSILGEIIRIRINRAKHLLEATDLPVVEIAAESGFANQNHFFRVFRRHTVMTPRSFRIARQLAAIDK